MTLTRLFPALPFATILDRFAPSTTATPHHDSGMTDDLSADRLADMGLPARTEANRRNSWEQGPVPRSDLW